MTTIVCKVLETLSWNENFARKAQNLGKVGNCFQYKFFWIIFLENLKLLEWYFINMYLHPCKPYSPRKYDTCHLQSKYQNYCLHFFLMSIILIDNLIFESTQQIFWWSWFWFNFHLFIWELKMVTFLHGKENYLFVNQGACGKKNFMAKSLQSLFFYNCQILSIVQYLVVSLSQNGCIILILSIYLSQVSCLYFKYHRLLNSGCSFCGDLSLHAS